MRYKGYSLIKCWCGYPEQRWMVYIGQRWVATYRTLTEAKNYVNNK